MMIIIMNQKRFSKGKLCHLVEIRSKYPNEHTAQITGNQIEVQDPVITTKNYEA